MVVLLIDSCEKNCLIELNKPGKIFTKKLQTGESTSENLLMKVQDLLQETNTNINEINVLSVCTGPGSFTGVRIAIATIKGLACGLKNVSIKSVNSFEKFAYKNNIKQNAVVLIPSGNEEVYYTTVCVKDNEYSFKEYGFKTWQEIVENAKENNYEIVADEEYKEELQNYFPLEHIKFLNSKGSTSEIIVKLFNEYGEDNINKVSPLYIKNSQAERELKSLVKLKSEIKKPIMPQDLLDIENECFTVNKFSLKMFEDELKQNTREYFVTYYKGKPIAYMGLMIVEQEMNLLKIAVVPEFRRLNLAINLLNKALEIKEKNNIETFYLEVNKENIKAIKLYEKMGFKVKHERKNYYENGDSCLVMFYEA